MDAISFFATITSIITFFGSVWRFIDNAQGFDETFDEFCGRVDEQAAKFDELLTGNEKLFGLACQRGGRAVTTDRLRETVQKLKKIYADIRGSRSIVTMMVRLQRKRNDITSLERQLESHIQDFQTSLGIMNLEVSLDLHRRLSNDSENSVLSSQGTSQDHVENTTPGPQQEISDVTSQETQPIPSVPGICRHGKRPPFRPKPQLAYYKSDFSLLTEISNPLDIRENFLLTVIAPSGDIVALLSKNAYIVFKVNNLPTLLCAGKFGSISTTEKKSVPVRLCSSDCAALSDEALVMSSKGRIMAITVTKDIAGRSSRVWDSLQNATINHLSFSRDGKQLLALTTRGDGNEQARIYAIDTASKEPKPVSCSGANWKLLDRVNKTASFSQNGEKIAICTSVPGNGNAEIRILKKNGTAWQKENTFKIPVHSENEEKGLTGVAFFANDEYLIWSIESKLSKPSFWYRLEPESGSLPVSSIPNTSPFGTSEAKIVNMAISAQFNGIAYIDADGKMHFKQHQFEFPSPDPRNKELNSGSTASYSQERHSLSFSKCGKKLLYLTAKVHPQIPEANSQGILEIHYFNPERD